MDTGEMGRWGRSRRNDAAGAGATPGGGADDAPSYPPMHLGGDDEQRSGSGTPVDDGETRPWTRRLGLGLAVVVGIVAGVVGANARHDAAEQSRVVLVAGRVVALELANAVDPRAPIWSAELMVFNAGPSPVDVLSLDVHGWHGPADGRQPEPATASPGSWASLRFRITPDCTADPPTGSASHVEARAHVRTATSEATVPLEFRPDHGWFRQAWTSTCSVAEPEYPDIVIDEAEVLPRAADSDVLRTRLHVRAVYPFLPRAGHSAALLRIRVHTRGLDVSTAGLPVTLGDEQASAVDIDWKISDCAEMEQLDNAALNFHVAPDTAATGTRVQNMTVPTPVLVALGRLSADVCRL